MNEEESGCGHTYYNGATSIFAAKLFAANFFVSKQLE
jgi:hypothetical protein